MNQRFKGLTFKIKESDNQSMIKHDKFKVGSLNTKFLNSSCLEIPQKAKAKLPSIKTGL